MRVAPAGWRRQGGQLKRRKLHYVSPNQPSRDCNPSHLPDAEHGSLGPHNHLLTFSPSGLSHEGLINIAEEEAITGEQGARARWPVLRGAGVGGALVHVHRSNARMYRCTYEAFFFPTAILKCFRLLEREVGRDLFHMSLRRDDRTKEPRKKPCLTTPGFEEIPQMYVSPVAVITAPPVCRWFWLSQRASSPVIRSWVLGASSAEIFHLASPRPSATERYKALTAQHSKDISVADVRVRSGCKMIERETEMTFRCKSTRTQKRKERKKRKKESSHTRSRTGVSACHLDERAI